MPDRNPTVRFFFQKNIILTCCDEPCKFSMKYLPMLPKNPNFTGIGFFSVLRIRIHWIHMFLGLPDPDPLVRGMDPDPALDPDPSITMQK
jgi:hypothetical protein